MISTDFVGTYIMRHTMMFVQRMNVLFISPDIKSRQVEASFCETKRWGNLCVNVPFRIFSHISDKVHLFVKNGWKVSWWE
jgi:hypothetical protein